MASANRCVSCATLAVASLLLPLVYLWIDPLQLGLTAGLHFRPQSVPPLPPLHSVSLSDPNQRLTNAQLRFVEELFGPESLSFDASGGGPYAGLSDGRVVRRSEDGGSWETVAVTSPHWNSSLCSYPDSPGLPRPQLATEHLCGRPLGIRFHPITGDLYVADAYFGIFRIPRIVEDGCNKSANQDLKGDDGEGEGEGGSGQRTCGAVNLSSRPKFGSPELVVDSADGTRLTFVNDVDIDVEVDSVGHAKSVLYFTDTNSKFKRRNFLACIYEGSALGRLIKHDLSTNATTVLVRGLRFANGVALSRDRSFLVFCDTTDMICNKYFLKGEKSGTWEKFVDLPGFPDNVRLNPRGRFWVAIHAKRTWLADFLRSSRWARLLVMKLIPDVRAVYLLTIGKPHGLVVEVDEMGSVTQVLEDSKGSVVKAVSEVEEHNGELWLGSVLMPHIAVLDNKNA